jgi:D-inositol-3-phosphate glycosyltransferase
MRILFFATYPNQPIGYARIGNILTNYLASIGHDVYYLGISNFKNIAVNRYIHPNIKLIDALTERRPDSTELYGVDIVCDIIAKVNPDIFLIYNDVIVISRIFNQFIESKINKQFKTYVYLDLVYEFEKIKFISHINAQSDHIFAFSECWKQNLIEMGVNELKIDVLPHGFDNLLFFPIVNPSKNKELFNFKEDDFIILNTNRNTYRKALDITIDAFIQFLKMNNYNPRLKLYLNLSTQMGYDILNLIQIICIKHKADYQTIVNQYIFTRNQNEFLSDSKLNQLYNACDVGINTCLGEGFGLCNLEHGGVGKPQIISKTGALKDIFTSEYSTLIEPKSQLYIDGHIDEHGGYIEICSPTDFANAINKYYHNHELAKEHGEKARTHIVSKYNWETILKEFGEKINKLANNR